MRPASCPPLGSPGAPTPTSRNEADISIRSEKVKDADEADVQDLQFLLRTVHDNENCSAVENVKGPDARASVASPSTSRQTEEVVRSNRTIIGTISLKNIHRQGISQSNVRLLLSR
jgi:hypothetical protein